MLPRLFSKFYKTSFLKLSLQQKKSFSIFINNPTVGLPLNSNDPKGPHFNSSFYDPDLDYDEELQDDIRLFGREKPDELDYTDVWESTYLSLICPEFFYHVFFCGFLYTLENEVYTK